MHYLQLLQMTTRHLSVDLQEITEKVFPSFCKVVSPFPKKKGLYATLVMLQGLH